jgi:2-polyprenyl-6-methoxyphenol hydroxylase-like FAD-dependent oxidoreductase
MPARRAGSFATGTAREMIPGMKRTALIVGGGIGGLAAAIALRQIGLDARVFERAPELGEVGAGLSIWPNGLRALGALGLAAEVRRRSLPDLESALRDRRGRVLVAASGAELEALLGDVSLVIHRAELLALLRRALPDEAIVTGSECLGFAESGRSIVARMADGSGPRGDLLVGADGLHSVVRAGLFGRERPRYAGYTAWRAVVRFDHRELTPGVSIGQGRQFGQVPMADGKVYWFATANGPPDQVRPDGGWRPHLEALFADWHAPIPALVGNTPEASILHNDIVDRDPIAVWGSGRVTLLGDAAHPMTPNLGQGANQALEDAVALAAALSATPDTAAALRAYEAARLPRANAVVVGSRRAGRVIQLANPLACWLRDALLRTRTATRMQQRQLRLIAGEIGPT